MISNHKRVNLTQPPIEDAAMLLRYSDHLATTGQITWNVGQKPVEGATDFLYMATVGEVARVFHEDAMLACRQVLYLCCLALAATVFLMARFAAGANRWLAFAMALYVVSAGGWTYVTSCFGAPFIMLFVALACGLGCGLIAGRLRPSWGVSILYSLFALMIGLTRPEGNFMAILLTCAILIMLGIRESRRLIVSFIGVMTLLGGAYFLWRWHYFGYLLPNPFYVKGGGHLHLKGLTDSVQNVVKMSLPLLPLCMLGLRSSVGRKRLMALALPVVAYTCLFIFLSHENNHLMRFQMPVLPVILLFLPLLAEGTVADLHLMPAALTLWVRRAMVAAGVAYLLLACSYIAKLYEGRLTESSAMAFARHLSKFSGRGYTMAVTEAGQFPYFSHWNAIDTLGLNDAEIAHHGISEQYLDESKPELIMYHHAPVPSAAGLVHADLGATQRYLEALRVMHHYAVSNGYILAASYGGDPCSLNVFYVKPNTPDTEEIVSYLRNTPYYFLDNGLLSADYRNGVRPECKLPDIE